MNPFPLDPFGFPNVKGNTGINSVCMSQHVHFNVSTSTVCPVVLGVWRCSPSPRLDDVVLHVQLGKRIDHVAWALLMHGGQ